MTLLVDIRKRARLVSKISSFILDLPDETIHRHLENEELLSEAIRIVFGSDLSKVDLSRLGIILPTEFPVPDIYNIEEQRDLKKPGANDFANAIIHPAIKILGQLPPRTRGHVIATIKWYLDYWGTKNAKTKAGKTFS